MMAKLKYRVLTDEQVSEILSVSNPEQITRTLMNNWFSADVSTVNGKAKVGKPKYYSTDVFTLPANTLINQKNEIKDTTIGIYIFNLFILVKSFGNVIPYINDTFSKKRIEQLEQTIIDHLTMGRLSVKDFTVFERSIVWLGYFTELFMPGMPLDFLKPNDEVLKLKKQLLKEHADVIASNDGVKYHDLIEKPLLAKAEEIMKENPAYSIYGIGSKPTFGNNYKNTCITNGSMFDPVTGKRVINTNSYIEGLPIDKYNVIANIAVFGTFSRSVQTQEGGTWTKYLSNAMQGVTLDERGSDCGTKRYMQVRLTKENYNSYKFNYILENGELKCLNVDIIKSYIGKTVLMRTPMYCQSEKLCNKCFGDLAYIQGFTNVGITATKASSVLMYKSMKAFHDISVKTRKIDLKNYIKFV